MLPLLTLMTNMSDWVFDILVLVRDHISILPQRSSRTMFVQEYLMEMVSQTAMGLQTVMERRRERSLNEQ